MRSLPKDPTQLLIDWSRGDNEALAQLIPLVYGELHRLAAAVLVQIEIENGRMRDDTSEDQAESAVRRPLV
jgi:hypothetical protein